MTTSCIFQFFLCIFMKILLTEGCERTLEIRGVEDYCWTKKIEVVERLHYTGKSVLNFAKKKLGMEVEADTDPQKCDYYVCIFQELKMLNGNGYPYYEKMSKWVKSNVVYNHAITILSQINYCSDRLANSTVSETYFFGDGVEELVSKGEIDIKPSEPQSKCEIISEFMKCMSLVEKGEKNINNLITRSRTL